MGEMNTLRSWYEKGKKGFLVQLALVGAIAGFAAWALAYVVLLLRGADGPTTTVLLGAILRGAFFGVVLGLILIVYWNRRI